ncbi:uncharacterized protein LOC113144070 [Mastacembelus armatus]|uniref:uncharacterized protein LOC113144070 n=1 Tax=Mastacembelus armatus TaxID=205130 RepID=UPI000E465077|nr:uncharacterized protein LOC113144070 [Mastacembelus armatus]
MVDRLAALILLGTAYLIQTAEVAHLLPFTVVEAGDNFTFMCQVPGKDVKFLFWYKQSLGHMIQTVAVLGLGKVTVSEEFKDSRFTVTQQQDQYFLNIRNVSKEDEATYLCQSGAMYTSSITNGTFLAVKDPNEQKTVYVKQTPETESVQLGDSVTLQCSLLSKNKENSVQCPGEHSVHWFRPRSGRFGPGVIYTHRNRSNEPEERSCIYSWSKTIQDSSDAGTYYCAVVTCGQILFGEGTTVDTRCLSESGSEVDPVVLVLGVLLVCCVTVIAGLIFYINHRKACGLCIGSATVTHDKSTENHSNDLHDEVKAANYAALDFSTSRVNRGKRRQSPQDCVYSVVRADYNQQHPSL